MLCGAHLALKEREGVNNNNNISNLLLSTEIAVPLNTPGFHFTSRHAFPSPSPSSPTKIVGRFGGSGEHSSASLLPASMAVAAFSIRGYVSSMRGAPAEGRSSFGVEDLPPMEAPRFRWWADEVEVAVAGAPAPAPASTPPPPPPPQPSRRTQAKARAPKKRSIADLFAAAPLLALPPAHAGDENKAPEVDGDDEALCSIMRRTKEQKRKRRLEEAAFAAAAAAAERPESGNNFVREQAHGRINVPDELDTPQASKKSEGIHDPRIDQDKIPDLKRKKKVDVNDLEKERIDKLRSIEGNKMSNKVGKQHDMKKMLPLHSILKKYTKHTSFKMVKEKSGNTKGKEVIELCRKSVKRVKFAEVDDVLGIDKQTSKRPQLESICKLFSDALASSSSSSTDMSTEGDRYVAAESSSSHMPELMEASKNMDHEDSLELVSTKLPSNLIDLNEALPESTDFNYPSVSNSEPDPEPTQHTLERVENSVSSGTLLQNELMEVADTNIASPPMKSTRELGEPHFSLNLNYGGTQLSNEGEVPPSQSQKHNASSSMAWSVHSAMDLQPERRPAAGQTVRLMGKDLAVSTPREDHPTELFLELPRQGRPYLSLQAQSVLPTISSQSAGTSQSHIRYTIPQNFSHSLSTANSLSEDQLQHEDRVRYLSDTQPHQNVHVGCPHFPNHGRAALHQSSSSPWCGYSDPLCRTAPPSAPILPTMTPRPRVSPSSNAHASLPTPGVVISARSSVLPHNSSGFTLTHPCRIVEEGSDSRRDAAFPSSSSDNVAARAAVPDLSNTSSGGRYVQRSGPVKLIPGAKHILMPSNSTGDGTTSMPVYSCVSFGSRRRNVSAPQNR
ncbi:hypothetical protein GUJ93_ZPchr0008g12706 [Zizania palustris]|nr:hypothetical protein GUJ93_ZPchr0008g12706 [Zizania palustris]